MSLVPIKLLKNKSNRTRLLRLKGETEEIDKNDYIDRLMAQYLDLYDLEIKEHEITNIEEYTLEATE